MKLAQLKSLVKKGESETLEFKTSTANLNAGMQTVCAFLNSSHGGTLIFGVTDKGQIVGQSVTDKTKKDIAIELNKIEPSADMDIDIVYIPVTSERKAIVFIVKPGRKAPYVYDDRSYFRRQSTTLKMPREKYVELYNQRNPELWESLLNDTCKISDLDSNRIKEVVRTGVFEKRLPESAMQESIPGILKKLDLIQNDKLTNAAVILFCKKEEKQFFQSYIQLARFRGTDKSEFLNSKRFKGNAFDLYEKAMDFLVSALPVAARIEEGNPDRIETPAIPYKVLREALINALIHRDYGSPSGSIEISIYDDRVDISNSGVLPSNLRISQLTKAHRSIPRNPLIAHVFYVCKKIERWGRGTLDMIQECKKAGNPLPIFDEEGGGFSVTLPLKEPMRTIITKEAANKPMLLTDRQKKIIDALNKGPLKMKQIMQATHLSVTDRVMQLELAKLRGMGLVKSEGQTKTVLWYLTKN